MQNNNFLNKYNLPNPVCLYKWNWSTIFLYLGTTNSCHRVQYDKITPETYHNFHNTPKKIADRQLMLKGQWPGGGCEYCRDIEKSGGISDRLEINEWGTNNYTPVETKTNPTQTNITPTMIEVYFNNTCNMGCIYCNSMFSTVWETEDLKYGTNRDNIIHLEKSKKEYPALLEAHWKWLKVNGTKLKRYHILGGEPFFQKEFEDNIEFFINNPCPDLEVAIFTNLKVEKEKMKKILNKVRDLIKNNHIKKFVMNLSIDGWGPQIEYIRTGLNLKRWEENFNIILNEYPEIGINIHSTLTSLCMSTYSQLCKNVAEWSKVRYVHQSASFVDAHSHMHVDAFPVGFFANEFKEAIENTPINELKIKLKGMEKRVDSVGESKDNIRKLKSELDKLDSRRGTNWKVVWPWLDQYEV